MSSPRDVLKELDESRLSSFHLKTVLTAGMGFFTDAYDLFVIGVVSSILKSVWNLSPLSISLLSSTALIAAAVGSVMFGRIADRFGRKFVYGYELLILAAGAIASAFSPNVAWLLIFRFILGLGIGGDYPVSSTLMSEYSNRRDRGKLITMVFSTQALGLIVGPLLVLILLVSGVSLDLTWRILLGVGAIPALATFYLRRNIAESPRFALSQGNTEETEQAIAQALGQARQSSRTENAGQSAEEVAATASQLLPKPIAFTKVRLRELFTTRHLLVWLIGAAGTWFMLDIAYYGTTVSTPFVIKLFSPKATLEETMLYTLLIFVVAALPGYIVAALTIDRIGRKKIQFLGFAMMALSYGVLFVFPQFTTLAATFLVAYGLSYFFTEFGPNVVTFVYPAEIFPVSVRTTAHGIAAATGKVGAFIGAFLFPVLLSSPSFLLPGSMGVASVVAVLGFALTFLLPEPDTKSLETIEREGEEEDVEAETRVGNS